jgi:hypothetical protein
MVVKVRKGDWRLRKHAQMHHGASGEIHAVDFVKENGRYKIIYY